MAETERIEVAKVRERFGEALIKVKQSCGATYLCVQRERLPEIAQFLKEEPELGFDYFVECVGVDYSQWTHERDLAERFEVVYNLMSSARGARLFLKIGVDDGQKAPTLRNLYLGAEYPEREVNDLFGIVFEGNEHPERLLMPDDWVGYPLRKEYPLGGEDVAFDQGVAGPAIEDKMTPHAGESFFGKTGSKDVSGR